MQTIRYAAMTAYGYWAVAQSEGEGVVKDLILRDLARPLFEPYGFCGGWTHCGPVGDARIAFDAPAFFAATIVQSVATGEVTCVDAVMTVRGQILTALFVPLLWLLVGFSMRRLGQRRWRPETTGSFRRLLLTVLLLPGLVTLPFVILGVPLLFASPWLSLRLWGHAFWMIYPTLLCAERLRVWPFQRPQNTSRAPN